MCAHPTHPRACCLLLFPFFVPMQGVAHAEVMRELSVRWKAQQRVGSGDSGGGGGGDELEGALRALDLSGGDIDDDEEEE